MSNLPGTHCRKCDGIIGKVGCTFGFPSVPLYGCEVCLQREVLAPKEHAMRFLAQYQNQDIPEAIIGIVFMGQAFAHQDGDLVPVAHPDDVWG